MDQGLGGRQRVPGQPQQFFGPGARCLQGIRAGWRDTMDQAHCLCFGGVEGAARQQEFHGPALADERHQARRAAPARRQAVVYLPERETRASRGQPQVAGGQNFAAAADGIPIDGGDDRNGKWIKAASAALITRFSRSPGGGLPWAANSFRSAPDMRASPAPLMIRARMASWRRGRGHRVGKSFLRGPIERCGTPGD